MVRDYFNIKMKESIVNKQPITRSIAVMPEIYDEDVSQCYGVCSDYIERYRIAKMDTTDALMHIHKNKE